MTERIECLETLVVTSASSCDFPPTILSAQILRGSMVSGTEVKDELQPMEYLNHVKYMLLTFITHVRIHLFGLLLRLADNSSKFFTLLLRKNRCELFQSCLTESKSKLTNTLRCFIVHHF